MSDVDVFISNSFATNSSPSGMTSEPPNATAPQATMASAIEELYHLQHNLTESINTLANIQISHLQNPPIPAPVSVVTAPGTSTSSPKVKLAPPDSFDGDPAKFETILRTVRAHFDVPGSSYASVQAKISFALSYMKGGTAATWADTISRSLANYPTWASFESELVKKFHNPFLEEDSPRTGPTYRP